MKIYRGKTKHGGQFQEGGAVRVRPKRHSRKRDQKTGGKTERVAVNFRKEELSE